MLGEASLPQRERILHARDAPIATPLEAADNDDGDGGPVPANITAAAEVIIERPHRHEHTNSVNRSYSDLDNGLFLLYAFALCAARTALQQPLNVALARKQTSSFYNALSTKAVIQRIFRREGGLRGLSQGMVAMTLGCALSEVIYLFLFEFWRERAPLASDAWKDAASGYGADAACRLIHIPFSIIAFRQMTAGSGATPRAASFIVRAEARPQWRGAGQKGPDITAWLSTRHSDVNGNSGSHHHHHYYHRPQRYRSAFRRAAVFRSSARACLHEWWGPRSVISAKSSWRTLLAMYRENGLQTVFAGYGATIAIGCQWSALWWALYGVSKAKLYTLADPVLLDEAAMARAQRGERGNREKVGVVGSGGAWASLQSHLPLWCLAKDDNLVINSVASVFTGASTAILFNPFLVIRTNLQTTPMATLRSATASVYHARGIRGFYSGLWLSVTTCIFDGVLASTSYEYAKLWADNSRHGQGKSPLTADRELAGDMNDAVDSSL